MWLRVREAYTPPHPSLLSVKPGEKFFTPFRLGILAIFLLAIAIYLPSMQGDPVWDDVGILNGVAIGGGTLEGVFKYPFNIAYYRPFTSLSYYLDRAIWGPLPFAYHQTNVLIHALGSLAVAWLAFVVSKRRTVGVVAGLFFAVQAAQVGAVAWIGGRTDALSALFCCVYLGCLALYFQRDDRRWLYAAAVLFFVAVMIKEQNGAMILAVPAGEWLLGKKNLGRAAKQLAVMAIPTVAFIALWFANYPNPHKLTSVDGLQLLARAATSTLHYLGMLFVPTGWTLGAISLANYDKPALYALGGTCSLAILIMVGMVAKKKPWAGWLLACALIAYLPVSNLVPMPSLLVGPYRIAVVGVAIAVLLGWVSVWAYESRRWAVVGVASLIFIANAGATWWANSIWMSEKAWFGTVAKYDNHSLIGQANYVLALMNNDEYEASLTAHDNYLNWALGGTDWVLRAERGLSIPATPTATWRIGTNVGSRSEIEPEISSLITRRGTILVRLKRDQEAEAHFRSAIAIGAERADPYASLGDIVITRNLNEAHYLYEKAAGFSPTYDNFARLARVEAMKGNHKRAEKLYLDSIKQRDWISVLWLGLAKSQAAQGKDDEALKSLEKARNTAFPNLIEIEKLKRQLLSSPKL